MATFKKRWSPVAALVTAIAAGVLFPSGAAAGDEVAALEARGEALPYSLPTQGSEIETGGAAILVHAPLARVESLVLRFGRYKEYVPAFEQSRLVQRHKSGETDVYVEVPVLSGASKLWALLRFSKPVKDAAGEVISARLIKGNMADFRAVWRLRAAGDDRTIVKLELFADPDLPVPDAFVEDGLVAASAKAVTGIRDHAEGRPPRR